MTKFILHGGETKVDSSDNAAFFREMGKGGLRVLCVYFAREKEGWAERFEEDKKNFSLAWPEKKFEFSLAEEKSFIEQAKNADVVYMRGGRTRRIFEFFKPIKNLKELFKGKTVGGSSAGACVLSRYYYSTSQDRIYEGTGVLPIKVFCHYNEGKKDKLEELKKHGEDLPVYAIEEQKMIVLDE
jgi:peptidase E